MSLLTFAVTGIPHDRFARIQAAATKELGFILTGVAGVVTSYGVQISYAYDGTSTLTFDVLKVPAIFGHDLVSPATVQSKINTAIAGIQ